MADLRIDIISDVVCPWCYLGYSRLKQAIEQLGDDYRIDIRWQPFELHPDMPIKGADRERYLGERFGSPEKLNEATHAIQQVGIEAGIQFNFSEKDRIPNTKLAHQFVLAATKSNLATPFVLALFHAYFTDGKDIGNQSILEDVALSIGMKTSDFEYALSDEAKALTQKKLQHLRSLEINSVPTYVINDKYMVQGAHDPESFLKVLTDIAEKQH
ncbi:MULTISPECIES: DsbA family oxidoreductase [Marinomonas]|uniref:DsbA family oxidoreductase n=1 Tax=Marinomonas arctica TaxID=383750 RepID=A0A7H1JAG8_9GAMM|nr:MULTISPECIES: DsbA family oxidoreductase [Marinomonas]MCS7486078.1 DSBA oxidoreductase [Marinomonas sp. BSi20414]QNT07484.1 DsbA family oxidoreductase [Marinomonas arctica]GGN26433.1 DSBA oxidoreductase [Marinomonas arctica]